MANSGGYKKTTIGDHQYCQLTTLVNSTSTALPIGLPPKEAEFCHTSNILLVGHRCHHALSRLYFSPLLLVISQLVGCLVDSPQ
jgi:hypothetical protein